MLHTDVNETKYKVPYSRKNNRKSTRGRSTQVITLSNGETKTIRHFRVEFMQSFRKLI